MVLQGVSLRAGRSSPTSSSTSGWEPVQLRNMFSVLGQAPFCHSSMAQFRYDQQHALRLLSGPIPNDAVDDEQVAHPRPGKSEKSGGSSSASGHQLDLRLHTFFVMLYLFKCWIHPAPLFQTGWFVESIMTQTLIIHIIRTNKIPSSRAAQAGRC